MTDSAYAAGKAAVRLAELDGMSEELGEVQRALLLPASEFGPSERRRLENRASELERATAKLRKQVKRDMSPSSPRTPSPNSPRLLSTPMHSIAKMQRAPAPAKPAEVVAFGLDSTTALNAIEKELTQIKKRFASGRLSEKERTLLNDRGCDLEEKSRWLRQTIRDNSPPQQKRPASPTGPGAVSATVSPEKVAELNKLAKEMSDIQKKLLNPRASEAEKKRLHAQGAAIEDKKVKVAQDVKRALTPPKPAPRPVEPTPLRPREDSPPHARKGASRSPSPNVNRSPSPLSSGPQSWGKDEEELEAMGKELSRMQRKLLKKTNIIEKRGLLTQVNELEAAAVCLKQAVRGQAGKDYLNLKVIQLVDSASEMRQQVEKDIRVVEAEEAERRKKQEEEETIRREKQDLEAERQRKREAEMNADEQHLVLQRQKKEAEKKAQERKAHEEKLKAEREIAADRAKLERKRRLDEAAKKRAIEMVRLENEAEAHARAQKKVADDELAKRQASLEAARYKAEKEAEKKRVEELQKAAAEKERLLALKLQDEQRAKNDEKIRLKVEQDKREQERAEKLANREEEGRRSKLAEAEEARRRQKEVWRLAAEKAAKEKERNEEEQRRRMERKAKQKADEKAKNAEKEAKEVKYRQMEKEKQLKRAKRERDYKRQAQEAKLQADEERELRIINARIKNNLASVNRSLSPATTRKLSQRAMSVETELASLTKEQYALQQQYLAAKRGSPEKSMLKKQSAEIDGEIAGAVARHQRYLSWEKWSNRETTIEGQCRSLEWPDVTEDDLMCVIENWQRKMRRREEREAMEQQRASLGSPVRLMPSVSISPVSRQESMTAQARSDVVKQKALQRAAASQYRYDSPLLNKQALE